MTTSTYVVVDEAGYGWHDPIEARDDAHALDIAHHIARSTEVEPGEWSVRAFLRVYHRPETDADEAHLVAMVDTVIDPDEPPCRDRQDHDWRDERVIGSGCGVLIRSACRTCGLVREIDTWHIGSYGSVYRAERYLEKTDIA